MTTALMADDSTLLREGLVELLERQGCEIVEQERRANALLATVAELAGRDALPDVVITDVRVPPTMTDDGLWVAIWIEEDHPRMTVLVLNQCVSPLHTQELSALPVLPGADGAGYLLKDRVTQVADFIGTLRIVAGEGMVTNPEVVRTIMQTSRSGLGEPTPRKLEIMEPMIQELSSNQIAGRFFLSRAAMMKHVSGIFSELGFEPGDENRRVYAILAFLNRPTS